MKRISFMILFSLFFFLVGANLLLAQVDTVLYEQFDNGEGQWATGWIDATNATAAFSIDTTGKLSGKNSYKGVITSAQLEMYRIQRIHDLPLVAGYQYTVSFMAVADSDALVNLLFELAGSPYTKRIDDTVSVTDSVQTYTFSMSATESVPTNQIKFMLGGAQNTGRTIWLDSIIVTRIPDPSLVSRWGSAPNLGSSWPILNDSSYAAGDAGMGSGAASSGWSTIRGGFDSLTATTSQALVVTGKLELVGGSGGSGYTWLRYALFGLNDTLNYALTDSARWTSSTTGNGYIFTPVSGAGNISNTYNTWPQGNQGTEWPLINAKNWNSTNSNGGGPFPVIMQAPYHQEATAGTYDWAISVQPQASGGNEVRWYLIQEHTAGSNDYYWWGGSFTDTAHTATFNGIGFGVDGGSNTATQLNLSQVRAQLGNPITIPLAPFQPFYVNQWGSAPNLGSSWPILNDSDYVDGNAGMGNGAASSGWSTIRGGFREAVTATTDKAIIVSGKLELVGGSGGSGYTWLRYALFNLNDTLNYALTDSARWTSSTTGNGYIFTPVSGAGNISNTYNSWPQGNQGTEWPLINAKNWNSTNSNGGGPFPVVMQAPYHAEATAGTYDWAISVQPQASGGNEVRWYLVKEASAGQQTEYWWAGSFTDTSHTATFNGIGFGVDGGSNTATQFNLVDVYVEKGDPITLPQRPWQQFYIPVDNWGFYGSNRVGGWTLTKGDQDGNVSISGSGAVTANQWSAVRGGFNAPVVFSDLPPDTSLVITGKMKFVGGGFDGWSGLRFGVFYSDSAGVIDSTASGPMWSGSEAYSTGYLFCPNSGTNDNPTWSGPGGNGSVGGVVNATWLSTNGANNYIISDQKTGDVSGAGTYDFKLTFKDMGSQGTAVGYSISGPSYLLEGHVMDTSSSRPTEFNAINFAVSGGNLSTTGLDITDVLVDLGSPVVTGVSNEKNNTLPMTYSLSQNYPNPFNPTTTIKFGLPKAGDVSLVVYDILGRKVTELVHGNLTAGYHTVNFNASNLASGVYFYRIQAGDFVSVKKLMLLK